MKIMVVDDSSTIRFMVTKILREMGYKDILAFESAEQALPALSNEKPDLVLLDWNLPKMAGIDFLNIIRQDSMFNRVKVIMATTVNDKGNILKALKIGIQGYICKPINRDVLVAKVKEMEVLISKENEATS
jgi:DNA-binding response OmpR family regulator